MPSCAPLVLVTQPGEDEVKATLPSGAVTTSVLNTGVPLESLDSAMYISENSVVPTRCSRGGMAHLPVVIAW